MAVVAERREKRHEDDVGVTDIRDADGGTGASPTGQIRGQQIQCEPILDAVLQVEATGIRRHQGPPNVGPNRAVRRRVPS